MTVFKWHIIVIILCVGINFSSAQGNYEFYFKGISAFNKADYQEAVMQLTKAIQKSDAPKEIILEMRGKSYLALQEFSYAEQDFAKLAELNLADGTYCLAQCFALQDNAVKAVEQLQIHLQQYLKKLKSDILLDPAFDSINTSEEWLALWSGDYYSKTEEQYADAVYHFRIKEYDFALDILDQMIMAKNRYHKAYSLRAEIYKDKGEYSRALSDLDEAIDLKKKQADYYAMRAEVYSITGKYKDAFEDIQQARNLDPSYSDYMLKEADILSRMEESQKAMELLTEYIAYFPTNTEALYTAGKCLYLQNNLADAADKFSTCIQIAPSNSKYWLARGNVNIAMSLPEKAIDDYSMSLDLDPKQGKVYYSRAFAYQELNEKERACNDFKKAFALGFKEALVHIQEYCGE
ncbi:MAG: tetratricopeptide repeat protein [Bacteroidales bacterium]|nr:tetratricopeptide repeat protein [Bacteroidales bacterium]MCF8458616.1 tetratricopeptide repeat protein [Bacteroidales bacterium]